MLTPEEMDAAGELVAAVYSRIESAMLLHLTRKLVEGDIGGQRAQTAMVLLSQSAAPALRKILHDSANDIDAAVRADVERALKASDARDLATIKRGLGIELASITTRQMATTVVGIGEILARHNLDMTAGAQAAFIAASTEAIANVNAGTMTSEQALHKAVRDLNGKGITVIQYGDPVTGRKTVANQADVAVRRHVRTQIAQAGMRRTEQVMDEAGIRFVEVTSHTGARPSHQEWEGRVYSRDGRQVVDGVTYEDFATACHLGDVADGIYGANCRHSHGPWIPGTPRTYFPDPEHPSGEGNTEIYDTTQVQRAMERRIRATKREIAGMQVVHDETGTESSAAELQRLKGKLRDQQAKVRELVADNAAILQRRPELEWAGDATARKPTR